MSAKYCFLICSLLLSIISSYKFVEGESAIFLDRNGCGVTKRCLFKPPGCDPQLDCAIGVIFFVSGPNQLTIQMVGQVIAPDTPPLQYIAVGFSDDSKMGNDYVSECVLSPSLRAFTEIEVFASYNNKEKTNDRIHLNDTEHSLMYSDIVGEVENGMMKCMFVQTIVPQFKSGNKRLPNLNRKIYIMVATGSAQTDEINPHDLSSTSHYYPILTSRSVNPAMVGEKLHPVPEEIKEETPTKAQNLEDNRTKFQGENGSGISSTMNLLMVLILVIGAIFFSTPINL